MARKDKKSQKRKYFHYEALNCTGLFLKSLFEAPTYLENSPQKAISQAETRRFRGLQFPDELAGLGKEPKPVRPSRLAGFVGSS